MSRLGDSSHLMMNAPFCPGSPKSLAPVVTKTRPGHSAQLAVKGRWENNAVRSHSTAARGGQNTVVAPRILEVPSAGGQPSFATLVSSILPFPQAAGANLSQ